MNLFGEKRRRKAKSGIHHDEDGATEKEDEIVGSTLRNFARRGNHRKGKTNRKRKEIYSV